MSIFQTSVIIPFYNSEKYISRAINSCLNLPDVGEIICVDDGSTDASCLIVDEIRQSNNKIILLQHPDRMNHGRSASRNLGIKNAKYDYIAFLDSDDEYTDCRFDNEKMIFEHDPSVEGVYGIVATKFENPQSKLEYDKRFGSHFIKIDTETKPEFLYKTLLFGNHGFFQTNSLTIKKSVFSKTGLFDDQLLVMQDAQMWIRIAAKCKLISNKNDKPIAIYHLHTTNSVINCDDLRLRLKPYLGTSLFIWALRQKDFSYDKKNDFFIGCKKYFSQENDFLTLTRFLWNNPTLLFNKFILRKIIQLTTNI